MVNKNSFIAQLEKLLLHLKNSKLEYLKASDKINPPQIKRYFNLIDKVLTNHLFSPSESAK